MILARVDRFFTQVKYLNAYSRVRTLEAMLRNAVGRDPENADPLPLVEPADGGELSLAAIARRLEHSNYMEARKARQKLIAAGTDGAAAALAVLNSMNEQARVMATIVVREAGSSRMVASLLAALSDDNADVRYHASFALREAFRRDFGYYYRDDAESRARAEERWKEYLFDRKE